MALCNHIIHYGPWLSCPYYNITTPSLHSREYHCLEPGDQLSNTVGMCPENLFLYRLLYIFLILFKSDTVRWAVVINNIINQSVPCTILTLVRLSYVSVAPISTVDQQS
jgi:hypothetical protein